MCDKNTDCKCISDILKVINILQKKADHHDDCEDICDRKTLGPTRFAKFNTRPVQLFLCCNNGDEPLLMPITKEPITGTTCFSNVFRVEKVDDCCATFRVLKPKVRVNAETQLNFDCDEEFEATCSFFTLDLKCVCIIRCLDDTFVDCL